MLVRCIGRGHPAFNKSGNHTFPVGTRNVVLEFSEGVADAGEDALVLVQDYPSLLVLVPVVDAPCPASEEPVDVIDYGAIVVPFLDPVVEMAFDEAIEAVGSDTVESKEDEVPKIAFTPTIQKKRKLKSKKG